MYPCIIPIIGITKPTEFKMRVFFLLNCHYVIVYSMVQDIPLRLAVDFDHTIHNPDNVLKGYKLGQPIAGAQKALQELKATGAIIVIHSVWADTEQKCQAISKWCRYFEIPYDFITNIKPIADCYLDDKAHQFLSWQESLAYLKKLRPGN
jgi:hypothetical protein